MRQLITRVDDDLHGRLKERAAAEGRSMNALVVSILEGALPVSDERARMRARLRAEGRLYEPPPPEGPVPSRDEVIEAMRGWGKAVIDALEADRASR